MYSEVPVRESSIARKIIKEIKSRGGVAVKYTPGVAGTPDILGCLGGVSLAIELKVPKKKPSASQESRMVEWRAAGAASFCATSVPEFLAKFAEFTSGGSCRTHKYPSTKRVLSVSPPTPLS